MNLSDNLKKIRKDNNLSQEALAEKLGVSRQAVSKWESGLAYPEMDKVLQICNMFNLNIDELLNQNIKEVNNNKQYKTNLNKYIDDFLGFFTKTINMFSSMRFKDIIKCIFEQLVLFAVIAIIISIVGSLLSSVISSLISFLPSNAYNLLFGLFSNIYLLIMWAIGVVIILHVFKTRYLDYYIIVDKDKENIEEDKEDKEKIIEEEIKVVDKKGKKYIERKEEKVIIRDPKHSGYRFISGLIKIVLFFFKIFLLFIGFSFCISLVFFAICFVMSFLFMKTGLIFLGMLLGDIACITVNVIILDVIYSFIVNRKVSKSIVGFTFIGSLVLFGIGIGMFALGFRDFKVINEYNEKYMTREEQTIIMENALFIETYLDNIEYIESDNNDIKIVYDHIKNSNVIIDKNENIYTIHSESYNNEFEELKNVLNNANDKVFVNPDYLKVYVYTNKVNIEKLKNNKKVYYERIRENEKNNMISELEKELNETKSRNNVLINENTEKSSKIEELEEKIKGNEEVISDLRSEVKNCNN